MGQEINLMENYPRTKRDPSQRAAAKTEEDRIIARRFGKEFFDGDRKVGYGGFQYHPRFWQPVIPAFQQYYNLTPRSSVLDVGCAKGFMLYDMIQLIPGITVRGIDISTYAIENAHPEVKQYVQVGDAVNLPFPDKSFDLVISITTVHNLERDACGKALQEMMRVSKGDAFIQIDGYHNDAEKKSLEDWILTAKTVMHVNEWRDFFREVGYTGDYCWFIP